MVENIIETQYEYENEKRPLHSDAEKIKDL